MYTGYAGSTVTLDCLQCGKEFCLYLGYYDSRKSGLFYCSRQCYHEHRTNDLQISNKDKMEKLAKIRWTNPCATLQEMGDRLGVSRERIRQMLNRLELPTRHYSEKKMVGCLQCGSPIREGKEFCNLKCHTAYNAIFVTCNQCGKLTRKTTARVISTEQRVKKGYKGNYYCDRKCFGRWFGENHSRRGISSVTLDCDECGKEFNLSFTEYNGRFKRSKSGRIFCSRKCSFSGKYHKNEKEGQNESK